MTPRIYTLAMAGILFCMVMVAGIIAEMRLSQIEGGMTVVSAKADREDR